MWVVSRLQVHGICSHRLLHKEVVEVRSNYNKSYFWWFGNPACDESPESNRIEKDQGRLVWGEKGQNTWFSVHGVPSDDWADGGYFDVLLTCGECGFGSLGSWSYSKEWVWNLGTKTVLRWNVSRVTLQGFIIRYWFLWDSQLYHISVA